MVAVDRNSEAPGLAEADIAKVVDFADAAAVIKATARHQARRGDDGQRRPRRAGRRGGRRGARAAGDRRRDRPPDDAQDRDAHAARRRRGAAAALAAVRSIAETRRAADEVGFPSVLKPADSGGQRGVFRVESLDEIDAHLHEVLVASPTGEAILEEFVEGVEMNGIVIARDGASIPLTLSDRLRPPGIGFGVGWIHVYPATAYGEQLEESERVAVHTVHALGLETGIAFPQLIATRRRPRHRRRVRRAHSRRADGRPRSRRDRRRPRRGADPDGARRGTARRARPAAVSPAARDPLLHRRARAAPDGPREADRPARQGARVSRRRAGGRLPAARRDDPARARSTATAAAT